MIDLKPELQAMIDAIAKQKMYRGTSMPQSIMRQFQIEQKEIAAGWLSSGVLVPYWLSIVEHGRGPRKTNQSSGLVDIIYKWMEKRSMFKSHTKVGRYKEAWLVTRKMNKKGNVQFREHAFMDIYTTVRRQTIEAIEKKFSLEISRITSEIL